MKTLEFLEQRVRVFQGLPRESIERVVAGSRTESFEPGALVARRGADATHFGVILSGTAAASIPDERGVGRILGRLEAGDTFAEAALLTGTALLADLTAESHTEVLCVPVSLFQSVLVATPSAAREIARTVAEHMQILSAAMFAAAPAGDGTSGATQDPYGLELRGERRERILVINCGSSSLKYSYYDTEDAPRHARGLVERIGIDGTRIVHRTAAGDSKRELPRAGYPDAFQAMTAALTAQPEGPLRSLDEVSIVVHRVVHGGEEFTEGTLITDDVLARVEALNPLAPLHNPLNVEGIRTMRKLCPKAPHIAVFDTAFHHTLPPHAYLYGLPYELYEKHRLRRYGFHGASHKYVSILAAKFLQRRPNELRLVTCHLGNGASLCAVDHGRSVDTSMGLTPTEGLIMGTRCGDVDPGAAAFLARVEGLTAEQYDGLLNKKSGLLGLSGKSSDMREILAAASAADPRALLSLKAYCYRVRKYIGAYVAAMGGVDAVVFTGGIGQGSAEVRALALQGLECMGLCLDDDRNREVQGVEEPRRISTENSQAAVLVVPTDEERMMAREALRTLGRSRVTSALASRVQDPIPVEVSAHHIHLTQEHVEALFGRGHQLTRHADLSQPGQYACKEQLTIVGPKGNVERVRVLGPTRRYTQIEVAMTEQFKLGLAPPIRESGDIAGTPGCVLEGPSGRLQLKEGVICALRHVHMTPENALQYGVRDKSVIRIRIPGDRELVFGDVLVRVDPSFALAMHIDTDEANAANVATGAIGYIESIQSQG